MSPRHGDVAPQPRLLLPARRRPGARRRPLLRRRPHQPDRPGEARRRPHQHAPPRPASSPPRARSRARRSRSSTPTNVHALLEFDSGASVTLGASWDVWAHRHRNMELYGTEGALFVPDPNWFGGTVELSGRDGKIAEVAQVGPPLRRPERHPPQRQLRQLPHRRPRRHGDGDHRGPRLPAARSTARCTASTS